MNYRIDPGPGLACLSFAVDPVSVVPGNVEHLLQDVCHNLGKQIKTLRTGGQFDVDNTSFADVPTIAESGYPVGR